MASCDDAAAAVTKAAKRRRGQLGLRRQSEGRQKTDFFVSLEPRERERVRVFFHQSGLSISISISNIKKNKSFFVPMNSLTQSFPCIYKIEQRVQIRDGLCFQNELKYKFLTWPATLLHVYIDLCVQAMV